MTARPRPWPLALLLAVVVALLGTASAGADQHAPTRHDAAIATPADNAGLAPTRSPGRLLTDVPRTADTDPWPGAEPAPPVVATVLLPRTGRLPDHGGTPPRVRRAPSTGDRAPPSH